MTEDEFQARVTAEMACPDCPAEVKVTFGVHIYARVIHAATCPWYARHLVDGNPGCIPCGVRHVTHRGPYKRSPVGP